MDKLQKLGAWLWRNKERMVLIVMVAVLAYRVYGIFNPPQEEAWARLPQPRLELPSDPEERQELGLPNMPPMPDPSTMPGVYTTLYDRNPFWYYSGQKESSGAEQISVEDLNIQLVDIQTVKDRPRARLRTARTVKWYSENEQFEEFEVTSIDAESETVVVYSQRYSKSFTLEKN